MTTTRAGIFGRQSRNKAKSIAEQIATGHAVAAENGWPVAKVYEEGTSASRYARKRREVWRACLADIGAGAFEVLILWEASRGDRTLTSWSAFLDLCRERGVQVYVITDERLYDPSKARDWKTLATAGVDSAGESDLLSVRVKRGHDGAAAAGRPGHGRVPYGYRRTYDPRSGALVGQEPDPVAAPVVREVFTRLASGEAISAVVDDFNTRGVPTAGAARWYRVRVRDLATNPTYIALRTHNGIAYAGCWEPLVDPALFYAVARILGDPKRVTTRPGKARHLLSYLGTCGVCGAPLTAVRGRYRCLDKGCVTIVQADTDAFVTRMVVVKLATPAVYDQLRQAGDDTDQAAVQAQAEVDALDVRLQQWRASAASGETSPASLAVIEGELTRQIRAAQRRAAAAGVPPELRAILEPGEDVQTRWDAAPLPARRRALAYMSTISIGPADKPGSRLFDYRRLGSSRWAGDPLTWGQRWPDDGA